MGPLQILRSCTAARYSWGPFAIQGQSDAWYLMTDDRASTQVWGPGGDRHGSAMPMVLMYHSVAPFEQDPYGITVSPARFDRQLRWLRRRGLRGVSMSTLLNAWR